MTVRYVGPGGSDGASGLTWALRKLTLNGVEDTPVVAGDTVYVGPGVYREILVVDVSGSNGQPITYIGDITGENTDGVGGVTIISGTSGYDVHPPTRTNCLTIDSKSYRTFRGICFEDILSGTQEPFVEIIGAGVASDIILEFCFLGTASQDASNMYGGIDYLNSNASSIDFIIRNCFFWSAAGGATISLLTQRDGGNTIIENNYFIGWQSYMTLTRLYNVIYRGNTLAALRGFYVYMDAGNHIHIYDSFFFNVWDCMDESTADSIIEDHNLLSGGGSTIEEGANTVSAHLPHVGPLLFSGYKFGWDVIDVGDYNSYTHMDDHQNLSKDLFGLVRPESPKKSPGAVQYKGVNRDSSEYRTSPSSIRMNDASIYIMNVPITGGKKVTAKIYVKREAGYSGQAPQLALSLPTQGRVVATDAGSTGIYNRLSVTVRTAAADRWLQIEIRSNNIATSGNYKVWFDDLKISASAGTIPTMKWITNEIPLFTFALDEVLDPWVTPSLPVPGATLGPVGLPSEVNPLPSFYRQE